ncbi:fused DSP-PTPase phosphatase/NAD kinase-like protein [Pseudoxanthomonas wuyuanensis]
MNRIFVRNLLGIALLLSATAFCALLGAAELRQPRPGLITGGPPTPEQLDQLVADGVHTVIDLRPAGEGDAARQEAQINARGLRFHRLPIAGADDLTAANAATLKRLLDESGDGVLLHCASGNRVGALLALMAVQQEQANPEQAMQLGKAAGMKSLEPVMAQRLLPQSAEKRDCVGATC